MKRKIWIHKAKSFEDVEEFDRKYYLSLSPEERLSDMQFLREQFFRINKIKFANGKRRIQKIARVIRDGKVIAELT